MRNGASTTAVARRSINELSKRSNSDWDAKNKRKLLRVKNRKH